MSNKQVLTSIEAERSDHDRSDAQIVEQCLDGDQEAWGVLLNKYQRLIQCIPLKYGASADDAADIFQTVSMDLFADLPKLREPQALRAWLMRVTARKCLRWRETQQRRAEDDLSEIDSNLPDSLIVAPTPLEAGEDERQVREAVARLPDRFRQLIQMLFYDQPPRSYQEIANTLGLARGSIPFLRSRCLKRLQQIMNEMQNELRSSKFRQ